MPMTTFLHEAELNQPTGSAELDELLAEVKARTGSNYQVVTRRDLACFGMLGLRRRIVESKQLYVYVGGMGPWQVLQCAHDVPTIRAFLLGLLNGTPSDADRFVPGVMHCAKCKFRVVRTNLYVRSGATGPGDNKTEPCPNGCGPLWPVTWEQEAREAMQRLEELSDRLAAGGGATTSLADFTEWLAREMPPGTVISDPRWWAPRIARALSRGARVGPEAGGA